MALLVLAVYFSYFSLFDLLILFAKANLTLTFVMGLREGVNLSPFLLLYFSLNDHCFERCFIINCVLGHEEYFRTIFELIGHAVIKL